MKNASQMFAPADSTLTSRQWWRSVASQFRDLADNENCSPLESARQLREWAASRADSPAFAAEVDRARAVAAQTVFANRPRGVEA